MQAHPRTVHEILCAGDRYLVPFFQRSYAWRPKDWKQLLEDLDTVLEAGPRGHHFLGPLVCARTDNVPGELPSYQLIDGQQRITTLTLFLTALRDVARQRGDDALAERISDSYLIHRHHKGQQRYKVVPRLADRPILHALLDGAEIPNRESRVAQAWRWFRDEIAERLERDGPGVLSALLQAATLGLSLVVITIDADRENPYDVFESLNNTGLALEEADLVRNFVFMQLRETDQEEFDEQHWRPFEDKFRGTPGESPINATAFYRDYLMREGRYSLARETYVDFKEQYRRRQLQPPLQVSELGRFLDFALWIHRPSTAPTPELRRALRGLAALGVSKVHPLVLALLDRHGQGQLSARDLHSCLSDLESFILRRSVTRAQTRPYDKWFVEAIRELGTAPLEGLRRYLLRRGWPHDARVVEGLATFELYRAGLGPCRLVLDRLEAADGHKEQVDSATLTVEHVMPQSIHAGAKGASWRAMLGEGWPVEHATLLHTLGNLTLSGYNAELSNRPYAEKQRDLLASRVGLNRWFEDVPAWTPAAIRERGRRLAEAVVREWPRPEGDEPGEDEVEAGSSEPAEAADGLSRIEQRNVAYWKGLLAEATRQGFDLPVKNLSTNRALSFVVVPDELFVYAWARPNRPRMLAVGLEGRGRGGRERFRRLFEQRAAIEATTPGEWRWWPDLGRPSCYVGREGEDWRDRDDQPRQWKWLVAALKRLHEAVLTLSAERPAP